jgi:hypothetical protein
MTVYNLDSPTLVSRAGQQRRGRSLVLPQSFILPWNDTQVDIDGAYRRAQTLEASPEDHRAHK